jgi:hypothetical protein
MVAIALVTLISDLHVTQGEVKEQRIEICMWAMDAAHLPVT